MSGVKKFTDSLLVTLCTAWDGRSREEVYEQDIIPLLESAIPELRFHTGAPEQLRECVIGFKQVIVFADAGLLDDAESLDQMIINKLGNLIMYLKNVDGSEMYHAN